jgi:hypothetical protein
MIHAGVIVSRKILRTRRGGRVLVIATTAPDEVEHHLRPVYGAHLHVHESQWTVEQYRIATGDLDDHYDAWRLLVVGDHVNAHGQVVIIASTVGEHADLLAWLAVQPRGLVDHRPWIRRNR